MINLGRGERKGLTLAMWMKTTKRGLPLSSILGRGGGGRLNWRDMSPFLPFALTTNTICLICWQGFWVRAEINECLIWASSYGLEEFDMCSRTSGFKDIHTSITIHSYAVFSVLSLSLSLKDAVFVFWLRRGWRERRLIHNVSEYFYGTQHSSWDQLKLAIKKERDKITKRTQGLGFIIS